MKYAILVGIVAGIIAAIIGAISTIFVLKAGLPYLYYPTEEMPLLPITKIFSIELILSIIFGIMLSIIFLQAYNVIPGERVTKYIVYGLFCLLIVGIREASFSIIYWGTTLKTLFDNASWIIIGLPQWIAYALVLGFLYEFFSAKKYIIMEKKRIIKFSMMNGAVLGAFLGIINGIVAVFFVMVYEYLYGFSLILPSIQNITVIMFRFGAHAFWHLLWGAIFGAIFARAYDVIPGKGVIKGLYYAYIIFLISTVHQGALYLTYGCIQPLGVLIQGLNIEMKEIWLLFGLEWIVVDIFVYALYGLLIGRLYKPPR